MNASLTHLQASSMPNVSIVKDMMIVIFLHKMDEQWHNTTQLIASSSLDEVEHDISDFIIEEKDVTYSHVLDEKKETLSASIYRETSTRFEN